MQEALTIIFMSLALSFGLDLPKHIKWIGHEIKAGIHHITKHGDTSCLPCSNVPKT